jgi:transcriptional regulator with XRE-family HTH domain
MTQERLAELLDISRRYVQRIEKGEANLGADILFGLPLALNVSWDELREAMPRTLSDWWRMKGKKKGQ